MRRRSSVVGKGPAKNLVADFLLVDLRTAFLEGLFSDVEEEIAEADRAAELLTAGDAVDEGASLLDARLDFSFFRQVLRVRVIGCKGHLTPTVCATSLARIRRRNQ
jgi:hypothetical protein